jgi:hypothetical protein
MFALPSLGVRSEVVAEVELLRFSLAADRTLVVPPLARLVAHVAPVQAKLVLKPSCPQLKRRTIGRRMAMRLLCRMMRMPFLPHQQGNAGAQQHSL